jgi:DNA-binding NtrC family response regulator
MATSPTVAQAARVLVVEDDLALSEMVCEELSARGHAATPARTVAQGLDRLQELEFDVALVDMNLPDGSGMELLKAIANDDLPVEAIVVTGDRDMDTAIQAMKLGAYDYITKPAGLEELEVRVEKAAEKSRLRRENRTLREGLRRLGPSPGLVTQDPAMNAVLATIERVAASELPILVQGESGTGKELVAQAVHQRSPRAGFPFMAIDCGALTETLLESELFGHEKGAFTGALLRKPGLFEVADRGVLFLDEVGDAPLSVQVKLLRVLETKEFLRVGGTRPVRADVRVVSATNQDLKEAMKKGRFREDLYYRLNGVTLRLPSLRDRIGDVPLLARFFADRYGSKKPFSAAALEVLKQYPWPGNVRELAMVIQHASVLSQGETILPEDLPLDMHDRSWKTGALRRSLTLAEVEQEYIEAMLAQHGGHRGNTARALGIDTKTLYNKLKRERMGEKPAS